MFYELWLPFGPESIELSDDSIDLGLNTSVVVSLQVLDKSIDWSFTESAKEELVELTLVLSGKLEKIEKNIRFNENVTKYHTKCTKQV